MSRSGYIDDMDDVLALGRYRAQVKSAIRGKRGQSFLLDLANAMDAMPEKILISNNLINEDGDCCAIGTVCKARGIDVSRVDVYKPEEVAKLVGIATQLAAEIEYENDEGGPYVGETDEARWKRMRAWVDRNLIHKHN